MQEGNRLDLTEATLSEFLASSTSVLEFAARQATTCSTILKNGWTCASANIHTQGLNQKFWDFASILLRLDSDSQYHGTPLLTPHRKRREGVVAWVRRKELVLWLPRSEHGVYQASGFRICISQGLGFRV